MSSDSDDDELSLAALKAKVVKKKNVAVQKLLEPEEFSSSDDEDGGGMSLAALKKKIVAKKKVATKKKKAVVAKKKKVVRRKTTKTGKATIVVGGKRKKTGGAKAAKAKAKKKSAPKKSSSSSSNDGESYMEAFRTKSFRVSRVRKKHLVEGILIRWKYVLQWPPASAVLAEPPKGYIMLRGYPGVYIGIHGEHCGKLIDNRTDTTDIPSFANLIQRTPDQLKGMLQDAIQKQIEELRAYDGPARLVADLELELKNAAKINTSRLK